MGYEADLHSTMVLLKEKGQKAANNAKDDLHSTMVLLKVDKIVDDSRRGNYLHSTMVLLKVIVGAFLMHKGGIYIPLWFY